MNGLTVIRTSDGMDATYTKLTSSEQFEWHWLEQDGRQGLCRLIDRMFEQSATVDGPYAGFNIAQANRLAMLLIVESGEPSAVVSTMLTRACAGQSYMDVRQVLRLSASVVIYRELQRRQEEGRVE